MTEIQNLLGEPLRVGEPDVSGPLAVFPVFGPDSRHDYVAFSQGRDQGVKVVETEGHASVNELVIQNPTDVSVLLYEGEEVLGAQQNRIFDVSILIAAQSKLTVPVSCVEAGRWESSRHADELAPAPQAAHPELRRMKGARKASRIHQRLAAAVEARADQSAVWASVDSKAARHGARSATGAMHDIYERRRSALEAIRGAIRLHPGQAGAIAAIGGEICVLDYVSRPEVFAALHGPLVQGYALDALEADNGDAPALETARGFTLLLGDSAVARRSPSVGLGDDARFASNGVVGSALVFDGELVQLTAFPGDEETGGRRRLALRGRVVRPSRRNR
jgi:hypothetical protein